jgi:enamine deaminase RidA (YjgF/YER057c/UK114 family)
MAVRAITAKELGPPLGMYSHGMVAPAGEIIAVAGQVGMDAAGHVVGTDVVSQTKQAFANIATVLRAAGVDMQDVVRFQTFLVRSADIDGFMQARREVFPAYYPDEVYPPNTLLVVSRLVQPGLLVEIEAMAVRPPKAAPAPAKRVAGNASRARSGSAAGRRAAPRKRR